MDWKYLFTSFEGRTSRSQFWLSIVVMIVVGIVLSVVVNMLFGGFNMTPATDPASAMATFQAVCWANIVTFLILAWPAAAVMIKRRHDRGSAGTEVWAYLGITLLSQLIAALGIDYSAQQMPMTDAYVATPGFIAGAIGLIIAIFAIYLLVVCGFLKGNAGENAYGPDPLA